jgi:hypothetical protein
MTTSTARAGWSLEAQSIASFEENLGRQIKRRTGGHSPWQQENASYRDELTLLLRFARSGCGGLQIIATFCIRPDSVCR